MSKSAKPSFAQTHPELAKQADGWDSSDVSTFSNKKMQWKCDLGHSWSARVSHRSKGIGCPICSNQKVLAGYNDLATTKPQLAAQADGWDPSAVGPNTNKNLPWKCDLGHKWSARVSHRSNGIGCPICSNQKVLAGYNDLATTNPQLAAQADGWDPSAVGPNTRKNLPWKCDLGHKWNATVVHRTNGTNCPFCSNKKILSNYNDLATTHPDLAVQADGWDPTTVSYGHSKNVQWVCEQGHTWKASPKSRVKGNDCPSCAIFGFKPKEDAWLYLLESEELELLQLGITNNPEERLAKHKRSGFGIVRDLRGPIDGYLARDLERSCIQILAKCGAIFANKLDVKKFDGWTESWTKKSFDVANIEVLLEWIYNAEGIHHD